MYLVDIDTFGRKLPAATAETPHCQSIYPQNRMSSTSLTARENCDTNDVNAVEFVKVAIVGAGASGLQCAHTLIRDFGFAPSDIVILEARERVGGRLYTTMETRRGLDGTSLHFAMDHGAAWVHGTGLDWEAPLSKEDRSNPMRNPMMALLEKATPSGESVYERHLNPIFLGNPWMRPQSIAHGANQIVLYVNGQELAKDSPLISLALKRHYALLDRVSDVGNTMFEQGEGMETTIQSVKETISKIQDEPNFRSELERLSEDDMEQVLALTPFYLHMIECWYGKETSDLQLCEFVDDKLNDDNADETYTAEGDFYGPHCTLKKGMSSILEPLLRDGVNKRIRLKEEVIKISNETNTVLLNTVLGTQIRANACVLTLPAGCLKETEGRYKFFEPAMSASKLEAISHMSMGSYKKVFLTFDRIFWPKEEAFLGMIRKSSFQTSDEPPGNCMLFDNLWARNDIPCIEAVLSGSAGSWAVGKNDEIIRDHVLSFMKDAMGIADEISSYCQDCQVTRWEEDPYSRGAYSSMSLGALNRHVEELRNPEWEGRLIFSGEATVTEFAGSVHAALFSGRNSAEKVNEYCTLVEAKLCCSQLDDAADKIGFLKPSKLNW